MALINIRDIHWGFGGAPLLEGIDLQVEAGERICLLGRNGAGKSSLLRLIGRKTAPDSGEILYRRGVTIGAMEQEVPQDMGGTVFEVVAGGISRLSASGSYPESAGNRAKMPEGNAFPAEDRLHDNTARAVEMTLSRTGLDPAPAFASLSAGMKRRVLFARALAAEPDLLVLDEPTNHLDIEAIEWMESYILRHVKTLLFVTHDRRFLKKIATRIVELDRGGLVSYNCDYDTYRARREGFLETQTRHQQRMDKKLCKEEAWIRQGIKARRTRNMGRVRALQKLREQVRQRRKHVGNARIRLQQAEMTGRIVIQAKDLALSYGDNPIIKNCSTTIMRGDKVGLIGPNGIGKTTLLNVLLKQMVPDRGEVKHGTRIQIAYYDQLRARLDLELTVRQNVAPDNDFIVFNGRKRHVISYLQDFLFTPDRCRTPVKILSGGERNRLMLARLFIQPANVLVLDEPTNDLDMETLELLEELLLEFSGTVLLVSHDRFFLNHVVTSTLAFEGQGRIVEYPGGYDDWLAQRPAPEAKASQKSSKPSKGKSFRQTDKPSTKPEKLGYMQARELEQLPAKIEALEAEQHQIQATMADPAFYKQSKEDITEMHNRLAALENSIAAAYARWEELG